MRSVPPRGSGWVMIVTRACHQRLTHPLPRGGADSMTRERQPSLPRSGTDSSLYNQCVMASPQQRLPENVPGDFFVDSTCIDCDTCSQLAPAIFRDHGDQCSVYHQPQNETETQRAMMALVSCPTGSIGSVGRHNEIGRAPV